MKRGIVFAVVALMLVSTWVLYSKVKEERREAAYQAAMVPFKRDLPIGTARAEVKRRLDSQKISYNVVNIGGNGGWTYEIEIGEEPGSIVCASWKVYVTLEFTPADTLSDIHIRKTGICL